MSETPKVAKFPKVNPEAVEALNRNLRAMRENMLAAGPNIGAAFQQMADAVKAAEWKPKP